MPNINSSQRFAHMLVLAGIIHILLLIPVDFRSKPQPSLNKMIATMLEVSLQASSNQKKPSVALNIALQNNDGPVLLNNDKNLVNEHTFQQEISLKQDLKATSPATPPRKRTVSAASHRSKDAAYLARWQAYIEQYGNAHYPDIALKNNLKGNLRLLVAIRKDGSLEAVSLRQSSGSPLLDQAAIKIVMDSAPFEPLPADISQDIEILEIIRTWQFRGKFTTSG